MSITANILAVGYWVAQRSPSRIQQLGLGAGCMPRSPNSCLSFWIPSSPGQGLCQTQEAPGRPRTWAECCRIASCLSWILRSSSRPVLRQSERSRRRDEPRSPHRSSVSSVEGESHRGSLPPLLPSTPSFYHLSPIRTYQAGLQTRYSFLWGLHPSAGSDGNLVGR